MKSSSIFFLLFFLFASCSSEGSKKYAEKAANATGAKAASAMSATKTAVKQIATPNPSKLGFEAFTAIQTNDLQRFKNCFISTANRSAMAESINAIDLTEEQRTNSFTFLDRTLDFLTRDDQAIVGNIFNKIKKAGADNGITWAKSELIDFKTEMVSINDFGLKWNVYEILINFKNDGKDHQLKIPTTYTLDEGILMSDIVLNF